MPDRLYHLPDDQAVYTFQLVGGPKGYYNRQHDRLLAAQAPALNRETLSALFTAAAEKIKEQLPESIYHDNGSTAALAWIGADDTIRTANIGDSRVTLFVKHQDGRIDGYQLTRDHNVYNPSERQRLEKLNATIDEGRVWAKGKNGHTFGLAISRAFGDGFAKSFVIDEPEILEFALSDPAFDIQKNDEIFICVDTDGVHMQLSPTYRAGALAAFLANPDNDITAVPRFLADLAILCGSGDNLSVAFARIAPGRHKNFVIAAFDGHGDDGYKVAESAAAAILGLIGKPAP